MKSLIRKNLITLRKNTGLKPADIAGFLKIPRVKFIELENGNEEIPLEHLERLEDLFRVELYDLVETDLTQKIPSPKLSLKAGRFSPDDLTAISRFNRIVKNYIKMNELNNRIK